MPRLLDPEGPYHAQNKIFSLLLICNMRLAHSLAGRRESVQKSPCHNYSMTSHLTHAKTYDVVWLDEITVDHVGSCHGNLYFLYFFFLKSPYFSLFFSLLFWATSPYFFPTFCWKVCGSPALGITFQQNPSRNPFPKSKNFQAKKTGVLMQNARRSSLGDCEKNFLDLVD